MLLASTSSLLAQSDVTQPGDPIIASSSNSPGSEGVANAIDNQQTKYLNFDSRTPNNPPSGFIVTPSVGVTRVTGMSIQTANDAPERDPFTVTIEGSNDPSVTDFASGNWEIIANIEVPAITGRFVTRSFSFPNFKAYKHYRWTSVATASPNGCCMQVAEVELLGTVLPPDVTQPGDPIIPSSSNSPGSEGVANAIDNQQTKYLNFDSRTPEPVPPSGFVVSPSIGRTLVTGMTIQTANDGPERDPRLVVLEGSNDATIAAYNSGTWEPIVTNEVTATTARFFTHTILFDNYKPYRHYRWISVETASPNGCCMQVAEVELLGTGAPVDVTQPGDNIIPSSSNSPGSEGVANAIDNQQTKYLNFDSRTPEPVPPSGFVVSPSIGASTVIGMSILTANDAPERDPKDVRLEGSNDDTIASYNSGTWEVITEVTFPATTARFAKQEVFFANQKSYKHYRWVSQTTQSPNGCCMQVAEVELLAVPQGADCSKARFVLQPVNTPVLEGESATFYAGVNGPWPVQWLRNGVAIPGAILTTYTTPEITTANNTNVYAIQILGCEVSSDVRAEIFTPSATKSVAISFIGGGANGAPTTINSNNIMGVFPQAYWNNAPDANNSLPVSVDQVDENGTVTNTINYLVLDSTGVESAITVSYQANGTWGSGTGVETPTARMLNGMLVDSPGVEPSPITFNNVPAGNHTVIVYGVSPPLQFQDIDYSVVGATTQTYYIRQINSDEYNAAPGWYRGSSTSPNARSIANYVRFENVQPDAGGTITVNMTEITTGYDRGTGASGVQLLLNAAPAGNPPIITVPPQPTVAADGSTARLTVTATGDNLTYQWRKNGRNIPNGGNISGATSSTLVIDDFSDTDAGVYSVAVFNSAGSVISINAALGLSEFSISDRLVGHWKFDETSGTVAANSVAGGAPGEVVGTPTWAAGKIANALTFDGATYVLITNYTKARAAISGSTWVYVEPGSAGDITLFRNAQGAMTVSGGAGRIVGQFEVLLDYDDATGEYRAQAAVGIGPNIARATGSTVVTLGAWHHVAYTADGAQLRVYLDGQQVGVTDYLAEINPPNIDYISAGAVLNVDASEPPVLGLDATAPNILIGRLDDMAVWTRALSADEVSRVFAAGNQGQSLSTVVVEPPDEEAEMTVAKNGNQITISWTGTGFTLQSSATVTGGWAPVAGVTGSSYTANAATGSLFYRLIKN
jgi:hypothetical protein